MFIVNDKHHTSAGLKGNKGTNGAKGQIGEKGPKIPSEGKESTKPQGVAREKGIAGQQKGEQGNFDINREKENIEPPEKIGR